MKSFGVHRMLDGQILRREYPSLNMGTVEKALTLLRLGDHKIPLEGIFFLEANPKEAHEAFARLTEERGEIPRDQY